MASQPKQIDLTTLSIQQLMELQKQLNSELEHLTNSFQSLRTAQSKFRDCIKSISTGLNEKTAEKSLLVPLTSSLYVPGNLASSETVLVDVGTGYFIEKSTTDATDFYNRKISDVGASLKDLEQIVQGKASNLKVVEDVLRAKVAAGQQADGEKK